MFNNLRSNYTKKVYLFILFLVLFLLFSVEHFIIPIIFKKDIAISINIFSSLLNSLFISILVTFILSVITLYFYPYKKKKSLEIEVLMPKDIEGALHKARQKTEIWCYNGSTARYTRNITIPYFINSCRENKKTVEIDIQIINPNNKKVCKFYSDYRMGLGYQMDVKTVRLELLATIISCYISKMEQPLLEINIGLKDYFSLFRADLSTNFIIITKEDHKEVALLYEKETIFYDAYYQDFIETSKQSTKLDLSLSFCYENEVTEEKINDLLSKLNLNEGLVKEDIGKILLILKNKKNIYA